MFFRIFVQFSNESNDTQLRWLLFSDFYLREFYPNMKLFFFWYIILLLTQIFK
jgi:hypothetical protein